MYSEKLDTWKNMLKKIPPYMINADGAVSEWMSPDLRDNYEHRHESHLYPVFPGTEVTRTDNAKLYKAFEKAVEKRKAFGLKDQSGWSLTFMANVYARMGKGDEAINVLDMLMRSNVMNNLTTVHNDWRRMGIATCGEQESPVQIDANMGFTSAINEMLVFSNQTWIFGNQFIIFTEEGQDADIWERTKKINESAQKSQLIGFNPDTSEITQEIIKCNEVIGKYFVMENGAEDPAAYWSDLKAELKEAGIEKIRQELTKQADEYLLKNNE